MQERDNRNDDTPPAAPPEEAMTLADLLAQVTEQNIHAAVDFGPPVGKELL